jgi:hypothetical protein
VGGGAFQTVFGTDGGGLLGLDPAVLSVSWPAASAIAGPGGGRELFESFGLGQGGGGGDAKPGVERAGVPVSGGEGDR